MTDVTKEEVYKACYGAAMYIHEHGMIKKQRVYYNQRNGSAPVCGTGALGMAICGNPALCEHEDHDGRVLRAALRAMGMKTVSDMYEFNDAAETTRERLLRKFEEGMRTTSPGSCWEVPEEKIPPPTYLGGEIANQISTTISFATNGGTWEMLGNSPSEVSAQMAAQMHAAGKSFSAAVNQITQACEAISMTSVSIDEADSLFFVADWALPATSKPKPATKATPRPTPVARTPVPSCETEGRLCRAAVMAYRRRRDRRGAHRRILVEEEATAA